MSIPESEYYQPGDIIYQGEPFVRVIQQELWDKVCANCFASTTSSLKRCGACRIMKYCGQSCQKKAWPDHKLECPFLRNCKDIKLQPCVQIVGNIILKINGRDWKTVTETVMGKEVSFDDLVSHTGTKLCPENVLDVKSIMDDVKKYIGQKNLPNKKNMLEIIGKEHYNSFQFILEEQVTDGVRQVADGLQLFIGGSKFDHSCVPNASRGNGKNGKAFTVRASKVIHKSEKITIAYAPMITKLESSGWKMGREIGFVDGCYCSDCSQPTGKSPLTKILDESKAVPVLKETEAILLSMSLSEQMILPVGIVTRERLSQLLQKQEGVLGRTNLQRMRTLAMKALLKDGPQEEMKRELLELAEAMKEVWGEYYDELIPVYCKILNISIAQKNEQDMWLYTRKIVRLNKVCHGFDIVKEAQSKQPTTDFHHFNSLMKR